MRKRSFTLAGHKTSLSLEPAFWDALEAMAARRGQTLTAAIREIDVTREGGNLSSAVRVAILRWLQSGADAAG